MSQLFGSYEDAWTAFSQADRMASFLDTQPPPGYLLSWHIPVGAEVAKATAGLRRTMGELGGFAVIPDDLLHVTVLPLGVTTVPDTHREHRELAAARKAWRRLSPFAVHFRPVGCFPTAVVVEVHDRGVFETIGLLRDLPPPATFLPHMTLAVSAARRPAAPVRAVLAPLREADTEFGEQIVDRLQLCRIRVGPGSLLEHWKVAGEVRLA